LVEIDAGLGSGIPNAVYKKAGAVLTDSPKKIYSNAEMIIKVKEPQSSEIDLLQKGQINFTYFHLAASEVLTVSLLQKKIIAVAYETIQLTDGSLPLLIPMSEIAGRLSIQEGAKFLERPMEGRGIILGGVSGVPPAEVVVIGGGMVGKNAAKIAAGLGAHVVVLDVNMNRLRYLDDIMPANVTTMFSNTFNLRAAVRRADLLIGAVLIVGSKAPVLVTKEMVKTMKKGSVVVDVSVDQGGCIETCHPTTHNNPTYLVSGVVHYCVANMPGAVPRTSTYALSNASFPYALALADKGFKKAMQEDPALLKGLNMINGKLTIQEVAEVFHLPYYPREKVLG